MRAYVTTTGTKAHGLIARSYGAAGGDGGKGNGIINGNPGVGADAGDGGTVNVSFEGSISTGGDDATAEQTAALDLDELGLDLSDFEDADLADLGESLDSDDEASVLQPGPDFGDLAGGLDSTAEVPAVSADEGSADDDFGDLGDIESTAEMQGLDAGPADSGDLDALTEALSRNTPGAGLGDTAEQPRPAIDETAEQPSPGAGDSLGLDLDLDTDWASGDEGEAGTAEAPSRPEGPTMTEVGTKLDLARAYIDMGDPDGARSILDEVLEEGDSGQRQEAQKLLDDLAS